ncbi:MAG: hypothetical protein U0804_23865 [Gemmataceae bacterium]
MTAHNSKPFRLFAVVALKRADCTEAIISLKPKEDAARKFARECLAAMPAELVRCRVQPLTLSLAQIKAICFRWGVEAAVAGEPVTNELPRVYAEEYRRGYESVTPRSTGPLSLRCPAAPA